MPYPTNYRYTREHEWIEIDGTIGTICCSDGEYPEAVRALAFNGAEVVYRPSEAMPMTGNSYPGGGGWMV